MTAPELPRTFSANCQHKGRRGNQPKKKGENANPEPTPNLQQNQRMHHTPTKTHPVFKLSGFTCSRSPRRTLLRAEPRRCDRCRRNPAGFQSNLPAPPPSREAAGTGQPHARFSGSPAARTAPWLRPPREGTERLRSRGERRLLLRPEEAARSACTRRARRGQAGQAVTKP